MTMRRRSRSRRRKTYIIAEAGINHNGSLDNCRKLIDAARDAGCNCVKFQAFKAKSLYPRSAGRLDWKDSDKRYSYDIYSAVESFELPSKWVRGLIGYCRRVGIDFLSSVFDKTSARYLVDMGMKMIKLPSYTITNLPLVEECAQYRLPIIMSTGGATMDEVKEAVDTVNRYHNKLSLLHCSIKYPTAPEECNLGIIKTLRSAFPENKIGYSDHTEGISKAPVQAIYLGARIIEKHITLDKKMKGPDHFFALEPDELKEMVNSIRRAEKERRRGGSRVVKRLRGSSGKRIFKHEKYLRDFCFATIFSTKKIKKGERIKYSNLKVLRPGKKKRGLEPKYINYFKEHKMRASKDIKKEEAISRDKVLNAKHTF